jgi:hypothetical protein
MAGGRGGFLAGLLLGAAPLVAAEAAAPAGDMLVPAQYYGPPPRRYRRRRRCWIERRPVVFYDRFGRPRRRVVAREVCR